MARTVGTATLKDDFVAIMNITGGTAKVETEEGVTLTVAYTELEDVAAGAETLALYVGLVERVGGRQAWELVTVMTSDMWACVLQDQM